MSSVSTSIDKFYPNQKHTGDEIVNHFRRSIRQVCLTANLQSGKTGTFQYVIRRLLKLKMVEQVIIISGMSDNDLKHQAERDSKYYNSRYASKIRVCFNRDLPKIKSVKNTLIVLDESHYGAS
jgi:hypothetical protein